MREGVRTLQWCCFALCCAILLLVMAGLSVRHELQDELDALRTRIEKLEGE